MRHLFFRRRRYGRPPKRRFTPNFRVSPETKRSITVLLLFAFGILTILSVLDIAGELGVAIVNMLSVLVGSSLVVFVALVAWLAAFIMLYPERFTVNAANYMGLLFLILSVTALAHIGLPLESAIEDAQAGAGGGLLGLVVSYPLQKFAGGFVTAVVSIILLLSSVILIFNTSLATLANGAHSIITTPLVALGGIIAKSFVFLRKLLVELFKKKESSTHEEGETYGEEEEEEDSADDTVRWETKELELAGTGTAGAPTIKTQPSLPAMKLKRNGLPSLSLLEDYSGKPTSGDIKANQDVIKKTLASFNIPVEMGDVTVGPTITRYTLKPSTGVKLSKISGLHNDLALALAAHPIRIEAPIPGQSLVGIEVPNKAVALVKMKSLLSSEHFKKRHSNLMVAIGRDVSGDAWIEDLASMPHMLVAGATGSGKSVCLNAMIVSLLFQNNPYDLKFILIDPKRVELPVYNRIPHLLAPVITDIPKVVNALKWSLREMDRRLELLSQKRKRNIADYNKHTAEPLPYIVIIIDELADLMSVALSEVEGAIIRLAQMARAVGIHLIVATQRPSVDVITGLIKANITTRIAFSVASSSDSRTILDSSGAEKLLGRGDMLYISAKLSKPKRLQGVFLSDNEIHRIVDYLHERHEQQFDESVTEKQSGVVMPGMPGGENIDDEELLIQAIEEVRKSQKASATFLQRRLRVGYARAGRIIDLLEERNIVGPADGAKAREVLLPRESDDTME